jgi:hypothetical protein
MSLSSGHTLAITTFTLKREVAGFTDILQHFVKLRQSETTTHV